MVCGVGVSAGEMDIARSPQVYRKDGPSFASPNRFWQEVSSVAALGTSSAAVWDPTSGSQLLFV